MDQYSNRTSRKGRFHRVMTLPLSEILGKDLNNLKCEELVQFREPVRAGCVELIDVDSGASIPGSIV